MVRNAYIKLVPASKQEKITTDEVKELFKYYKEITGKTGEQLGYKYDEDAFPYEIKEKDGGKGKWFYLKSEKPDFNMIMIGVDEEEIEDENGEKRTQSYIQLTLPETATIGDKAKGNEFCKFLAKKLEGELHLFNGRVMYFYKRK